jgi:hypothetical protein
LDTHRGTTRGDAAYLGFDIGMLALGDMPFGPPQLVNAAISTAGQKDHAAILIEFTIDTCSIKPLYVRGLILF